MEIRIEIEDIKVEDFDDFIRDIADRIFMKSQENLVKVLEWDDPKRKPSKISDTGFLLRSGRPPERTQEGYKIIYDAPYADYVEYGTDPHPISGEILVSWVRRKLGIRDKRARNVAWAIANKIRKYGIPPHPFMRPAIEETKSEFE